MRALRRWTSVCLVVTLSVIGATSVVAGEQKVVLGQIQLSFYAVAGAVIQGVLETLGHPVEVREGVHETIFPALGRGEVDLLAAAWLPGAHAIYWAQYKDQAIELATLYDGARLFWAVPDYVPESLVRSVDDLLKPDVASKMAKTIRGIGAGSGLMMGSKKMMTEYGLEQAGYELVPGPPKDWIGNFEKAVAERRWVIIPLWRPQFLNKAYRVRPLDEPKRLLGGTDRAVLVANKEFPNRFPAKTVDTLRRIDLGVDAVTEMDYMVNVERKSPREAAKVWMARNADRVQSWMGRNRGDRDTRLLTPSQGRAKEAVGR